MTLLDVAGQATGSPALYFAVPELWDSPDNLFNTEVLDAFDAWVPVIGGLGLIYFGLLFQVRRRRREPRYHLFGR